MERNLEIERISQAKISLLEKKLVEE